MSDEIGKVIRRDLDRLPVLPEGRWMPTVTPARLSPRDVGRRCLGLALVVFLALWAGVELDRSRGDVLSRLGGPTMNTTGSTNAPIPSKIGRDRAIALVRARPELGHVDRIEAKLLSLEEYVRLAGPIRLHPGDPQASPFGGFNITGDPAKRSTWVVAVAGEVWPNGRLPTFFGTSPVASSTPFPPYRWGVFLVDALAGQLMTVGDAGINESWPAAFDALPNHPATAEVPASPTALLATLRVGILSPEAMSAVLRRSNEIRRVDRIELRLMTGAELERAQPNGGSAIARADAPVWVVAVGGVIVRPSAPATEFPSAVYAVDANTGAILDVRLSAEGWPLYFDTLPNHPGE